MADTGFDDEEFFADLYGPVTEEYDKGVDKSSRYSDTAPPIQREPSPAPELSAVTDAAASQTDSNMESEQTQAPPIHTDHTANGMDASTAVHENGHDFGSSSMYRDDQRAEKEDTPIGIKEDG
jgi:hypothetical protein